MKRRRGKRQRCIKTGEKLIKEREIKAKRKDNNKYQAGKNRTKREKRRAKITQ